MAQFSFSGPEIETKTDVIKDLQNQVNYLSNKIEELERPNKQVNLGIKLLTPSAKMPTQAHKGDLWDVYADETVLITDEKSTLVSTGIALDIPQGYQVRLYNRSGNPLKYGIVLGNSTGIVDSSYRGELKGQFFCIKGVHQIHKGDRIMQMEVVRVLDIEFEQKENLSQTDRGEQGFGSSGR